MFRQIAALLIALGVCAVAVADDRPYKEGPVTNVAFIRVKSGKLMDYIAYLSGTYKQEMEANKKAGLISDYKIYQVAPRHPDDANLILSVTYPNYAALDRTAEIDAIVAKVEGSLKAADNSTANRGSIREILGSELIRELVLK